MKNWEEEYFKNKYRSRYYQIKKNKRSSTINKLLVVLLFLAVVALSSFVGFMIPVLSKFALLQTFLTLSPNEQLITETNILVLGVDEAFGSNRSDTIMVLHLDPLNNTAAVLSIPRDTLVVIPGRGLDKINHAFAYGGPDLTRRTVENFLGISVPHYVTVDVHGLANIIDELGGVSLNVEKRMYYVDYAGGLYINLFPGVQTLSGKDAVAYVRFRQDGEGDFGRIRRQQQFLTSIANQLMHRKNLFKSPRLFLELIGKVNTTLNSREILGVALGVRSAYELGQVHMAQIPGDGMMIDGIYYYKTNTAELEILAEKHLKKRISNIGSKELWEKNQES